ncbi:MAG: YbjN domain-containing protein [Deltaproteobacteria bacterium]|nr:YbjN domain-containing protein [Deltaproteobacteria bacterium]
MSSYFDKIIDFSGRLSLDIIKQDDSEELIVVNNEDKGIYHMVIDCEYPILIMEQLIYHLKNPSEQHFKRLLQINRNLIHGAFVLDNDVNQMIFRDTLQLENLDFNEFEGTINGLSLGLAEYSKELISLNNPE